MKLDVTDATVLAFGREKLLRE